MYLWCGSKRREARETGIEIKLCLFIKKKGDDGERQNYTGISVN